MSDKDFLAEYAKSGRAACKGCKDNIGKDSLRIARMVQSRHFDGKQPNWYHYSCFFPKQVTPSLRTTADIGGFDALRWEDQKKIKEKVEQCVGKVDSSGGAGAAGLSVEYAKSNRSTCRGSGCGDFIEKGAVRVSKLVEADPARAAFTGAMVPAWHHVQCFFKDWDVGDLKTSSFAGFSKLSEDDKKVFEAEVKKSQKGKAASEAVKRPKEETKAEDSEAAKKAKLMDLRVERELKAQSALLWKTHDEINKYLTTQQMRDLLSHNRQPQHGGENQLRERLSDRMVFGVIAKCENCKGGDYEYRSEGYQCMGDLTAWTKCMNVTTDPKRTEFRIPEELRETNPWLKKYKFTPRTRKFPPRQEGTKDKNGLEAASAPEKRTEGGGAHKMEKPAAEGEKKKRGANRPSIEATAVIDKPLEGIKVAFAGKLKASRPALKELVETYGGSVASKPSVAHIVISTKGEIEREASQVMEAIEAGVPVMSEDYLSYVGDKKKRPPPSMYRISPEEETRKRSADGSEGGAGKKMKLTVKGRAAVDPASGLEETTHVYEKGKDVYSMVLSLSDVARGTNSFYKLQLLENDTGNGYHVFRSWGRIGVEGIGGNKVEKFKRLQDALDLFCQLFEDKSGNAWQDRAKFVKRPNKFYPVEMDYGAEDEAVQQALAKTAKAGQNSKLPMPVQELVQLIFDIDQFRKTLVEFEIDIAKMPLGKLSKAQIEKAYRLLTDLQNLVEQTEEAQSQKASQLILDASNRFYTLIPHDFGMKKPPLIDSVDAVRSKASLLDNLLEMEIAASLLSAAATGHEGEDPIDVRYQSLHTDISVLDRTSTEFDLIQKYVANTHAKTHTQYKLAVEDVFCIRREGEESRYQPLKANDNRMLLWHGSRITNFAGILSNGLKIAPPEAPVTGYMFGKGVYFADMVSKSANYCNATADNPYGLLLLCEVALGSMYELTAAKYITKLPKGKQSTKGVGSTQPDPKQAVTLSDGVVVPCGSGIPVYKDTSLLYNEYIVYDVSQINIKYLLKVRFDFRRAAA